MNERSLIPPVSETMQTLVLVMAEADGDVDELEFDELLHAARSRVAVPMTATAPSVLRTGCPFVGE